MRRTYKVHEAKGDAVDEDALAASVGRSLRNEQLCEIGQSTYKRRRTELSPIWPYKALNHPS